MDKRQLLEALGTKITSSTRHRVRLYNCNTGLFEDIDLVTAYPGDAVRLEIGETAYIVHASALEAIAAFARTSQPAADSASPE